MIPSKFQNPKIPHFSQKENMGKKDLYSLQFKQITTFSQSGQLISYFLFNAKEINQENIRSRNDYKAQKLITAY